MSVKVEITKGFKTPDGYLTEEYIVAELVKATQKKDEFGIRFLTLMLKQLGVLHKYPEYFL